MGRPLSLLASLSPEFVWFVRYFWFGVLLSHVRKDLLEDNMQQAVQIVQAQGIPKFLGSHPELYLNKQNIGRRRQKGGTRLSYIWIRYIQKVSGLLLYYRSKKCSNVRIGSICLKVILFITV
jgi:hypothetical protein